MNRKLQDLCLRRIIEKFDTYLKFHMSRDVKLNRMFQFLLRIYSEKIISELYDRDQLEFKHADVLINKYLTSINTDWFQTQNWEVISTKLASIGSTLKKLHVDRNTGKLPEKDVLCYLPNLEIISFDERCCSDETLEWIAEFCPNIVELCLDFSSISVIGIKHLGMKENGSISCPKLKRLSILETNIWRKDIEYILENFPYLEYIDHDVLPIVLFDRHKAGVLKTHQTISYSLTYLRILYFPYSFTHSEYNHLLTVCISVCPHLKELRCAIRTEEHLDTLSRLKNLTKLIARCPDDSSISVNGLLKCIGSSLKSLTMGCSSVSVPVLADSCPQLEELRTRYVHFQTDNDSSNLVFPRLSLCSFTGFDDAMDLASFREVCALLSAACLLTDVHFTYCLFSSEMQTELLNVFRHCPLERIDFEDSLIKYDFVVKILKSCSSLTELTLSISFKESTEFEKDLNAVALTLPMKPVIHIIDQCTAFLNGLQCVTSFRH